jgi:hypothetical protein
MPGNAPTLVGIAGDSDCAGMIPWGSSPMAGFDSDPVVTSLAAFAGEPRPPPGRLRVLDF